MIIQIQVECDKRFMKRMGFGWTGLILGMSCWFGCGCWAARVVKTSARAISTLDLAYFDNLACNDFLGTNLVGLLSSTSNRLLTENSAI